MNKRFNLIGFVYNIALVSLILTCQQSYGINTRIFGSVYSLEYLDQNPQLITAHYNELMQRFDNSDFDEILFSNSNAEGQRLSELDHQLMFDAIIKFFRQNPELNFTDYLSERPTINPFLIDYSEQSATVVELVPESDRFGHFLDTQKKQFNLNTWFRELSEDQQVDLLRLIQKTNPEVTSFFMLSAKKLSENLDLFQSVLVAFGKLLMIKKSDGGLKGLAHLLTNYWIYINQLSNSEFETLDRINQYWLRSSFLVDINNLVKEFKLPSALANNFLSILGFNQRNSFSLKNKKITLVPMTRWEYLFKGIGPGECIRASCNRFFDGLYPFSFGFSILSEGKELGYIGIYEVNVKDSSLKRWYIDTVQSPGLVTITDHLQKLALQNNALIVVAAEDWNSINFKENAAHLNMRGDIDTEEVAFPSSDILSAIFGFVGNPEQNHHQQIMIRSGYVDNSEQMYDSLLRNKYLVRVLEPSDSADQYEIERYLNLIDRSPPSVQDLTTRNSPANLLDRLNRLGDKALIARSRMAQIYLNNKLLFLNSVGLSSKAKEFVFPILSTQVIGFNFNLPSQKDINKIYKRLNPDQNLDLLFELITLSSNSAQMLEWIEMLSNNTVLFSRMLIHFIIPRLEQNGFNKWIELYQIILPKGPNDVVDISLAQAIISKIENFDDYFDFVSISKGLVKGAGLVGDKKFINALIAVTFRQFVEKYSGADLYEKAEVILNNVDTSADIAVRKSLLALATSIEQIHRVINLSNPPLPNDSTSYNLSILRALNKFKIYNGSDAEYFIQILSSMNSTEISNNYIYSDILKNLTFDDSRYWLKLYEILLKQAKSDEQDMMLATAIVKKVNNIQLAEFFKISNGKPVRMATPELRSKFFANEIVSRYPLESDVQVKIEILIQILIHSKPQDLIPALKELVVASSSENDFLIIIKFLVQLGNSYDLKEISGVLGQTLKLNGIALNKPIIDLLTQVNYPSYSNIHSSFSYNHRNIHLFDFLEAYITPTNLESVPKNLLVLAKRSSRVQSQKDKIDLWIKKKNINVVESLSLISKFKAYVNSFFYPSTDVPTNDSLTKTNQEKGSCSLYLAH